MHSNVLTQQSAIICTTNYIKNYCAVTIQIEAWFGAWPEHALKFPITLYAFEQYLKIFPYYAPIMLICVPLSPIITLRDYNFSCTINVTVNISIRILLVCSNLLHVHSNNFSDV